MKTFKNVKERNADRCFRTEHYFSRDNEELDRDDFYSDEYVDDYVWKLYDEDYLGKDKDQDPSVLYKDWNEYFI
ncbi:MAG: hypothetical protein IJT77_13240 [Clostridia bacterium]|nr:hypothetical protein [Clostridia bacterium]